MTGTIAESIGRDNIQAQYEDSIF